MWDFLDILASPDDWEVMVKNEEFHLRPIEKAPTTQLTLNGSWFDHPDCRVPIYESDPHMTCDTSEEQSVNATRSDQRR